MGFFSWFKTKPPEIIVEKMTYEELEYAYKDLEKTVDSLWDKIYYKNDQIESLTDRKDLLLKDKETLEDHLKTYTDMCEKYRKDLEAITQPYNYATIEDIESVRNDMQFYSADTRNLYERMMEAEQKIISLEESGVMMPHVGVGNGVFTKSAPVHSHVDF